MAAGARDNSAEELAQTPDMVETQQINLQEYREKLKLKRDTEKENSGQPDEIPENALGLLHITDTQHEKVSTHALVDESVIVGRHECCNVLVHCSLVSRQHLKLEHKLGHWQVVDLESTNGTTIDGSSLQANVPVPWLPGQTIGIGRYLLTLESTSRFDCTDYRTYLGTEILPAGEKEFADLFTVEPEELVVAPGQQAEVSLRVCEGLSWSQLNFELHGVPEEWYLFQDEKLLFDIPEDATGGRLLLGLVASHEKFASECNLVLEVASAINIAAVLEPAEIGVQEEGILEISNNSTEEVLVELVLSSEDALQIATSSRFRRVRPESSEAVKIRIERCKRQIFGSPRLAGYSVQVVHPEIEAIQLDGHVHVKPFVSSRMLYFLLITVLLAAAMTVVGSRYLSYENKVEASAPVSAAVKVPASSAADRQSEELQERLDSITGGLLYEVGSYELTDDKKRRLEDVAEVLRQFPDYRVRIVGQTDALGSPEVNLRIGLKRAITVLKHLQQKLGTDFEADRFIVSARNVPQSRGEDIESRRVFFELVR